MDSLPPLSLAPPVREFKRSRVSSPFGERRSPAHGGRSFHAGIDIRAATREEVLAAAGGIVSFAGRQRDYGIVVVLDHGARWATVYAHLSEALVAMGDSVAAGAIIGRVGTSGNATGPHLHFELRRAGKALDPCGWL